MTAGTTMILVFSCLSQYDRPVRHALIIDHHILVDFESSLLEPPIEGLATCIRFFGYTPLGEFFTHHLRRLSSDEIARTLLNWDGNLLELVDLKKNVGSKYLCLPVILLVLRVTTKDYRINLLELVQIV